jgi:uncharacterized membrane-anchored protein
MKQVYMTIALFLCALTSFAQTEQETDSTQYRIQQIEAALTYQYGEITLGDGLAKITVPKGFKYLDAEQANFVLTQLWGNPESGSTLGMLLPEDKGVLEASTWVFDIQFDEIGYVKDADANEIDYAELLTTMQQETRDGNAIRLANGYDAIQLIGWASNPYYDHDKKILHWAKELSFGDMEEHTLNYNIRILGRKGVLMLNAIANMEDLPTVKANIPLITSSVNFEQGHSYFDFDPNVDEVAAWTLSGLVAGKMLTKIGFFAGLLKFWKVIAVAIAAGGGALLKWFKGRREEEEEQVAYVQEEEDQRVAN